MSIKISKGGKLVKTKWEFNPSEQEGRYVRTDITDNTPMYLFMDCELDEGVVLKDVFLLINKHLEFFSVVLNNWVEEFVAECFQDGEKDKDLEYLELYWHIEDDVKMYGNTRPCFHGVDKNGESWGISGVSIREYSHLPVKLSKTLTIITDHSKNRSVQTFEAPEFSLGQILDGIVWEISYYGPPAKRDAMWDMIRKDMADALKEMDTLD